MIKRKGAHDAAAAAETAAAEAKPSLVSRLMPKTGGGLVLRTVLLLVIPYAYLMLCGLVFDMLLKWYFMTGFIFYSLITLYVIAIVLIVLMAVKFSKNRRKGE